MPVAWPRILHLEMPAATAGAIIRTNVESLSLKAWVAVIGCYLATAIVVTYPLVRHLGTAVAGRPGDTGFFLWCMDTFWTNLREGTNPFVTSRIFYPTGANLAYSSCAPLLSLLAWPWLADLPLFAALLALTSLVVAAIGTMLLVRELTADAGAAIIAGGLYGFCPTVLSLLWESQLAQTVAAAMVPFGMLFLLRFWRTGGWRPLLGLAATAWGMFLIQFYSLVAFLLLGTVMSLVLIPRHVTRRHVRRLALVLATSTMLLWALTTLVYPPIDFADLPRGGYGFTSRSVVNLADLLVPSERHLLFGSHHRAWASDAFNRDVDSYFLGWVVLPLALGAAARSWRRPAVAAIAVAGLVVLLLAAGSAIRIGPAVLFEREWTPFDWFRRLPTMEMLDSPRRFVVGTAFAVTVLAGVGLAMLARWSRRRHMVLAAGIALGVLDYGQVGMPVTPLAVPAVYRILADRPGTGTVLELGGGLAYSSGGLGLDWGIPSSHLMYWQTVHRKPRIGGYVARIPRSVFRQFRYTPILGELFAMTHGGKGPPPNTTYLPEEVTAFLRTFDVGWVIVPPHKRQADYAEVVEGILAGHLTSMECSPDGALLYTLADVHSARLAGVTRGLL